MAGVKSYGALEENNNDEVRERISDNDNSSIEGAAKTESLLGQVPQTCNKEIRNAVLGVFLSLLSGGIFTANNFIIKELEVVVSDAVLVRCFLQITILSFIIMANGEKLLPEDMKDRLFTIAQGICGATALICSLACISFMPVADGLTLMFCCPAVTIVLSATLLGDKLTLTKLLAGLCLVCGAVCVCQPTAIFGQTVKQGREEEQKHSTKYFIGVGLATTCCFAGGMMDVCITMAQRVSLPVLVNWVGLCGLSVSIMYSVLDPSSRLLSSAIFSVSLNNWLVLVGLALSGMTAFCLMTKSLHLISPNLVSSLRSLELVVAFGVQTVLTGQAPNVWDCLGASLVMAGVLLLSLQEQIANVLLTVRRRLTSYAGI